MGSQPIRQLHQPRRTPELGVAIAGQQGSLRRLGSPPGDARSRPRLTAAEREALRSLREAVRLLRVRARAAGIGHALQGVTLLLRDADATRRGPWAAQGTVAVGRRNGLLAQAPTAALPQVLLPLDTALHELAHVVQFARIPAGIRPHPAIIEGIADSVAMLATRDSTLGEGYFRRDRDGRHRGAIRVTGAGADAHPRTPVLGRTAHHLEQALAPATGAHEAGGVVSTAFARIRDQLGWARAERLLWAVIADTDAWRAGGSWGALRESLRRNAAALWPRDAAARGVVAEVLQSTGLVGAPRDEPIARAA